MHGDGTDAGDDAAYAVDNVHQFIHILLQFAGYGDSLFGEFLDICQLSLSLGHFLIDFVGCAGNLHNRVGEIFVLAAGIFQGAAEYGFRGIGYFLRDINDLVCLMLHGQVQGADLHHRIDVFLKNFDKLFSSVGKSLVHII